MAAQGSAKHVRHALEAVEGASGALELLAAARELRESADALEIAAVGEARNHGRTWTQIGAVYGTTKQGAQQRFRGALARENSSG